MPRMNYVWVGPPPSKRNVGMDTVGPDLMRQHDPEQEIHFYCLDSQVTHYQTYFDKRHPSKKPIEVHGIESYVRGLDPIPYDKEEMKYVGHPLKSPIPPPQFHAITIRDEDSDLLMRQPEEKPTDSPKKKMELSPKEICLKEAFLLFIEKLTKRAEKFDSPKDKIQERITIKDAFNYFIQINEKGFIADSNVIPDLFEGGFELKAPDAFASCYLHETRADPFIMYNTGHDDKAKVRFANYLYGASLFLSLCEKEEESKPQTKVKVTQLPPSKGQTDSPPVRLMIEDQFTKHAADAIKLQTFSPKEARGFGDLRCTKYGLHKRFFNTHKEKTEFDEIPPLYRILLSKHSSAELGYYLEKSTHFNVFKPYTFINPYTGNPITATFAQCANARGVKDLMLMLAIVSEEDELLTNINTLLKLMDQILPADLKSPPLTSLKSLEEALTKRENNNLEKVIHLLTKNGPVSAENLEAYLASFEAMHQDEKPKHTPALFKEAASSFDIDEARESLKALYVLPIPNPT